MEEILKKSFVLKNSFCEFNKENEEFYIYTNNKEFVFNGKSTHDLNEMFPLMRKNFTVSEIAVSLNLPTEYISQIIKILIDKNLVIVVSSNYKQFSNESIENIYFSSIEESKESSFPNHLGLFLGKKIGFVGNEYLYNAFSYSLRNIFDLEYIENIDRIQSEHDLLIAVDVYENINLFQSVNEFSYKNNTNFLKAIVTSNEISVGPIFIATESACYQCWLSRYITNFEEPSPFLKIGKNYIADRNDSNILPGSLEVIIGIIKRHLLNYFDDKTGSHLIDNEYYLNLNNFDSSLSPVLKLPNCKICNQRISRRLIYEVEK